MRVELPVITGAVLLMTVDSTDRALTGWNCFNSDIQGEMLRADDSEDFLDRLSHWVCSG